MNFLIYYDLDDKFHVWRHIQHQIRMADVVFTVDTTGMPNTVKNSINSLYDAPP